MDLDSSPLTMDGLLYRGGWLVVGFIDLVPPAFV